MFFVIFIILLYMQNPTYAINDIPQDFDAKKPFIIKEIAQKMPSRDTITYTEVPRGIILSIAQTEIFEGNSYNISIAGAHLLYHIANLLKTFENNCTIEAHTEERINTNGIYKEDWEISIIRASKIADYLVYQLGIERERLFPIGFGKLMPFRSNVSDIDFANNRIDFVIFDYALVK